MKKIKIGVVTVTYGSREVLPDFIKSLKIQKFKDFVVYLIDNNSKDGSVDYYRNNSEGLRSVVIENSDNFGVAKANNQGILAALGESCDYILLLNNDVDFPQDLFSGLIESAVAESADIVVPKMYYYDEPKKVWCAGGGFISKRGLTAVHYGFGEVDEGQFSGISKCDYSPTCCSLISAKVFSNIGLMDEKYFVYYDDTDFMYRAAQSNARIICNCDVYLHHKVSSLTGGGDLSTFALRFLTRNRIYFLRKHTHGIFYVIWLFYTQMQMLRDYFFKGIGFKGYKITQKAFFEGIFLK